MSKDKGRASRKRRTREHVIADLSVNHVERHALLCGFTIQRITHDYGLDVTITTYSRQGDIENGLIWLQLKATDHPQHVRKETAIAIRVQRKDLLHWMGEHDPVMLVLYDATRDTGYWLHVQAEFAGGKLFGLARTGSTLTVHVPLAQIVNEDAMRTFQKLKQKARTGWRKGARNDG